MNGLVSARSEDFVIGSIRALTSHLNLRLGQIGQTSGILMLRERLKPINSVVLDLVQ
jgi:hypothetical protein